MVLPPLPPAIATITLALALQLSLWPPMSGPHAPPLPLTVPLTDPSGKHTGTATISGDRTYIRNLKGEHVSTIVIGRDGSKTLYDPNGKILDQQK